MTDFLDETIPQNSESPTLGAQRIRETRSGFNEVLTVEHDISDSATTKGFHGTNVTGKVDTSIATPPSGYGRFGWKTIGGVAELFYRDDAGNEKQISNAGQLNIVDADGAVVKTGAQTIAGVKTFSSSPIVPTPTTGTQAANKTYADAAPKAQMKADGVAGATYGAGTESSTDANGKVTKSGAIAHTTDTPKTVTFANAFTAGCVPVVVLTARNSSNDDIRLQLVGAPSNINFVAQPVGANTLTHIEWIAIGF